MTMSIDLTAINTTRATEQVVAMMEAAGLKPCYGPDGTRPYQGAVRIVFDERGRSGAFGVILVGSRSGRILRGEFYYGNDSAAHKLNCYWEVRRAIAALLERKRGTGAKKQEAGR
jgi:hypothetical protein